MKTQSMPDFKNARIIEAARYGSTISGIAHDTGIPFATVRRTVYEFDNIGVIKTTKRGNRVFVRISDHNHPIVKSMKYAAEWISSVIWDPDTFVARIFAKNGIEYAFIGTTRVKYAKNESRNMVQIAVKKKHCQNATKIIQSCFGELGIRITKDVNRTIGNAMSVIYVKCFPVDHIKYQTVNVHALYFNETVCINIADEATDSKATAVMSEKDKMYIPLCA